MACGTASGYIYIFMGREVVASTAEPVHRGGRVSAICSVNDHSFLVTGGTDGKCCVLNAELQLVSTFDVAALVSLGKESRLSSGVSALNAMMDEDDNLRLLLGTEEGEILRITTATEKVHLDDTLSLSLSLPNPKHTHTHTICIF